MMPIMKNESGNVVWCSDSVKPHPITMPCLWKSIDFNHVRGFDSSRGRVSLPLSCTRFPPSVLSFPGNRKQSIFTLMRQIPSMQLLHTVFSVLHDLTAFPSFLTLPWGFCQCTQCFLEHYETITLKEGKCGKRHLPAASLQPHPVS